MDDFGGRGGGGWGLRGAADLGNDSAKLSLDSFRYALRIWVFIKPYSCRLACMLALVLFSSALAVLPPRLTQLLIDEALVYKDTGLLQYLCFLMVCVPIVDGLVRVAKSAEVAVISANLTADLRVAMYSHFASLSVSFFHFARTGELTARLDADVSRAKEAITSTFLDLITNAVKLATALGMMASVNWRLACMTIPIIPLFVIPAQFYLKTIRELTLVSLDSSARLQALATETLGIDGVLLMKVFGKQRRNISDYRERSGAVIDASIDSAMAGSVLWTCLSLATAIGTAVIFYLGGLQVLSGELTIGTVVAFTSYLRMFYSPFSALVNSKVDLAKALVSFQRIFEVLDLEVDIYDRPGAVELQPQLQQGISFSNVGFSYDLVRKLSISAPERAMRRHLNMTMSGQKIVTESRSPAAVRGSSAPLDGPRWVLRGIDFFIQPGETVALVGRSGAGKTTLSALLSRLYDVQEGSISIDGVDLRDIALQSLSHLIGCVSQDTFLFNDTIRANLQYAHPTEDATDEELVQVLRMANIWKFVESLPDGLDTILGERGHRLSGGEKQRLSIARCLLLNPSVLVLDEATSSLDGESEKLIQDALEKAFLRNRSRTCIAIAHRLSTIMCADRIIVLDKGAIVQVGSHAELMAEESGFYHFLFQTQFSGYTQHASNDSH